MKSSTWTRSNDVDLYNIINEYESTINAYIDEIKAKDDIIEELSNYIEENEIKLENNNIKDGNNGEYLNANSVSDIYLLTETIERLELENKEMFEKNEMLTIEIQNLNEIINECSSRLLVYEAKEEKYELEMNNIAEKNVLYQEEVNTLKQQLNKQLEFLHRITNMEDVDNAVSDITLTSRNANKEGGITGEDCGINAVDGEHVDVSVGSIDLSVFDISSKDPEMSNESIVNMNKADLMLIQPDVSLLAIGASHPEDTRIPSPNHTKPDELYSQRPNVDISNHSIPKTCNKNISKTEPKRISVHPVRRDVIVSHSDDVVGNSSDRKSIPVNSSNETCSDSLGYSKGNGFTAPLRIREPNINSTQALNHRSSYKNMNNSDAIPPEPMASSSLPETPLNDVSEIDTKGPDKHAVLIIEEYDECMPNEEYSASHHRYKNKTNRQLYRPVPELVSKGKNSFCGVAIKTANNMLFTKSTVTKQNVNANKIINVRKTENDCQSRLDQVIPFDEDIEFDDC